MPYMSVNDLSIGLILLSNLPFNFVNDGRKSKGGYKGENLPVIFLINDQIS